MQLTWFLHAVAVSLFAGAAAGLADRVLARLGRSRRGAWLGAIAVSALLPLFAFFQPGFADAIMGTLARAIEVDTYSLRDLLLPLREHQYLFSLRLPDLTTLVFGVWLLGGCVVALWLGFGAWQLRRRRSGWERGELCGESCYVSREIGPAVAGIVRHRLVVPDWIFGLEAGEQEMVLAHEREHLRRRDPWMIGVAYAALFLFPWNPVLWWQVRRFRLALEMDCDRRVVAEGRDRARYSRLLVDVARRQPRAVAAFASRETHLSRRVRYLMQPPRDRGTMSALQVGGLLVLGLLAFAVPRPVYPLADPGDVATVEEAHRRTPSLHDRAPKLLDLGATAGRLRRVLRTFGVDGVNETTFLLHVDASGRVDAAVVAWPLLEDSPRLKARLEEVGRGMRFRPAALRGRDVPIWWAVTVTLSSPGEAAR